MSKTMRATWPPSHHCGECGRSFYHSRTLAQHVVATHPEAATPGVDAILAADPPARLVKAEAPPSLWPFTLPAVIAVLVAGLAWWVWS